MKLKREEAEKLLKAGHISPDTFGRIKFAGGGEVPGEIPEGSREFLNQLVGQGKFRDSGRPSSGVAESMDSYLGAPVRRFLDDAAQHGLSAEAALNALKSMGTDPAKAPTGYDVASHMGIENPYAGAAVATAADLAQLPVPGVPVGIRGEIKGVKDAGKIADAAEAFAARGKAPATAEQRIAQMYGQNGEVRDAMPKLVDRAGKEWQTAGRKGVSMADLNAENQAYGVSTQRSAYDSERTAPAKAAEPMREKLPKGAAMTPAQGGFWHDDNNHSYTDEAKQHLSNISARYGDHAPQVEEALQSIASSEGQDHMPYLGQAIHGKAKINVPLPNYDAKPTGVIGEPRIQGMSSQAADPFAWMDHKYGAAKQLLERHKSLGMPAEINTSSDLIAHKDYIDAIPKGSTVNLHMLTGDNNLDRMMFPGNASQKRLEAAAQKLEDAGIKVNRIYPNSSADVINGSKQAYGHDMSKVTGMGDEELARHIDERLQESAKQRGDHLKPVRYANGGLVKPMNFADGGDVPGAAAQVPADQGFLSRLGGLFTSDGRQALAQQMAQDKAPPAPVAAPEPDVTPQAGQSQALQPMTAAQPGALASDVTNAQQMNPQAQMVTDYYGRLMKGMGGAFGMQESGLKQAADAGAKQATAEASYYQKAIDDSQRMLQEQQVKEQHRNQSLEDQAKAIQNISDQYNNAKVDPNRVFHNASTGQKIGMFIGLALAGKAAPELVNQIVTRDIDAQKNDISNIGRKLDAQQNLYTEMRQRFGDSRQAELASRMVMLDNVKLRMEQTAAQYKAPIIQAQAKTAIGQIEAQKQQAGMQLMQSYMTSPAMISKDAQLGSIMRLPDQNVKAMALKELGVQDTAKRTLGDIDKTFGRLEQLQKSGSRLGTPLQSKSLIDAYNLQLSSYAKEMYGRVNETELNLLLRNGSVSYTDDPATIREKKDIFKNFIRTKNQTPVLDRLNLGMKTLDLKPNG